MKSLSLLLIVFVMLLSVSFASLYAQGENPTSTPTVTPDYTLYTIFPHGLDCTGMNNEIAIGPTWRNIVIGESTKQDLENEYGAASPFFDMYRITGEDFVIRFCVNNEVITALDVDSDIDAFEDFVRIHGEPDVLTNDISTDIRIAFWFEEGIAISIWVNTSSEEYFGRVGSIVYFPFQELDGYEDRWPYTSTAQELGFAENIEAPNPFDFDAMAATLTLQPSFTPSPTLLAYATPSPTAIIVPVATATP